RRPGHSRGHPGEPAASDRRGAAGYGAVQRHDLLQHRLWPSRGAARRDRRRCTPRPHPRFHHGIAGWLSDDGRRARPQAFRRGERRALARAITLVESTRPDHRDEAERLVEALLPQTRAAVRIGISGPPGAGKSTFIERFGLDGITLGRRIAVLAVDPSSKRGGGAILGDKTRMTELARASAAFIRPSSAGDRAGGVARRTREAILLC